MANAMKIHLKKNAAANVLALNERLQGLTATDVTHSRKSKAAIHICPHKYRENSPSSIIRHSLLIKFRNKTGISAPSDLHSPGGFAMLLLLLFLLLFILFSCCFYILSYLRYDI